MNLVILVLLYLVFFYVQVKIRPSEKALAAIAVGLAVIGFLLFPIKLTYVMYGIGLVFGIVIEEGLGKISRDQHWSNAHYFDIPIWLPLVWGLGFIAISHTALWLAIVLQ